MGDDKGPSARFTKLQARLDSLTRKWWVYLLLAGIFFLPAYASNGYDPRRTVDLIGEVLSQPLINALPVLMPIAKVVPLVLLVGLLAYGNKARRAFNVYAALLYLVLAVFQTTAVTPTFGFVILLGNMVMVLIVALSWVWEVIAERNDFEPRRRSLARWWFAPLALLALMEPVDTASMSPDLSPLRLITNEAGLTFCLMTPLVLGMMTVFYPGVNLTVLRLTSFAGILLGVANLIVWFGVESWGWLMGVLHIPLVAISVYGFVLGQARADRGIRRAVAAEIGA